MKLLFLLWLTQAPLPEPQPVVEPATQREPTDTEAATPTPPAALEETNPEAAPPLPPESAPQETPAPEPPPTTVVAPSTPEPLVEPPVPGARHLVRVGAGGAVGLLAWAPSMVMCCGSAALMASVYPQSRGDPTVNFGALWPTVCCLGVCGGMVGWVLGLGGTLCGTGLVAAGLSAGTAVADDDGPQSPFRSKPLRAALLAVAAAGLPALVVAALSGVLPWASVFLWTALAPRLPTGGSWTYGRWLGLNALFMTAVTAGLVLLATAAALPLAAGFGTYAVTARLFTAE